MENQIVIVLEEQRRGKKKVYQTHHKIKLPHRKYELLESQEKTIKYRHMQDCFDYNRSEMNSGSAWVVTRKQSC